MKKSVMCAEIGRLTILLLLVLFVCVGCTKSGAPSCADEAVKKMAIDISRVKVRNALYREAFAKGNDFIYFPTYDSAKIIRAVRRDRLAKGDSLTVEEKRILELMDVVDKQAADPKISLTNIRTNGKHDDVKKCDCSGDLDLGGKALAIDYMAQYTEDGKIYVEVDGHR